MSIYVEVTLHLVATMLPLGLFDA